MIWDKALTLTLPSRFVCNSRGIPRRQGACVFLTRGTDPSSVLGALNMELPPPIEFLACVTFTCRRLFFVGRFGLYR